MEYHLKALIGVGTFAEVWHAMRLNDDGQRCGSDVALKIGRCPVDDQRSEDERAALYQILPRQYDGVITILDVALPYQTLVVAMELAEISLLGIRLNGGAVLECFRHIAQVAVTLDDLHSGSIIHGGINPTDVLIVNGRAKVADIGPLPRAGTSAFIPIYKSMCMAPELRKGRPVPESDQFALAATYAWLRTLNGTFSRSNHAGPTIAMDLSRLPKQEKDVLLMALDSVPTRRFASCRAFANALEQAIMYEQEKTDTFELQ